MIVHAAMYFTLRKINNCDLNACRMLIQNSVSFKHICISIDITHYLW